ncbi:hypothetical protein RDn1_068 [Candidatus Termititenax dinenymphae]|uniref:LysM domain-containing protein n=1 Tax=Candidatus Termititenax dinenymphae TaxID=2218523 RepID=A0A388TJF7_9BACT|nr:hypothetical protein RDn1_068 [Candidatus Termititenax dinenymphae]
MVFPIRLDIAGTPTTARIQGNPQTPETETTRKSINQQNGVPENGAAIGTFLNAPRPEIINQNPIINQYLTKYEMLLKKDGINNPQEFLEDLFSQLDEITDTSEDKEELLAYILDVREKYGLPYEQQLGYIKENFDPEIGVVSLDIQRWTPVGQLRSNLNTILAEPLTYTIQPGDTLSKIAGKLSEQTGRKITVQELQDVNGIKDANKIFAGAKLKFSALSAEEIEAGGLSVLFSQVDKDTVHTALDGLEEHPQVQSVLNSIENNLLVQYSSKMILKSEDVLKLKDEFVNILNKNAGKIQDLLDINNDPALSRKDCLQKTGEILREIFGEIASGVIMAESASLKEKIDIVSDVKFRAESTGFSAQINKYVEEMNEIVEKYKTAAPAEKAELDKRFNELLGLAQEWMQKIPAGTSHEDIGNVTKDFANVINKAVSVGLLTPEEAQKNLFQLFSNVLDFLANEAETQQQDWLKNINFQNAKIPPSPALKYDHIRELCRSKITEYLEAQRDEEAREDKLKEIRKELANLNLPPQIRSLLNSLFGIKLEDIDPAVAVALAEKIKTGNFADLKVG